MADLPIIWKPLPGFQQNALRRGEFESLWGGAAGPGKTDCLIAVGARYAQHPKASVLFLRTNFTDMRDVMDRMHVRYPVLGATWKESEKRWTFPSGGTLECGYGDGIGEISRYLGREFSAVLYDELAQLADEYPWQMLLSRIRSTDPTVPLRARASANPIGPGRDWLKRRFVDVCGKRGETVFHDDETGRTRSYVPGRADDNPMLPKSYWDGLKDLPPSIQQALRDGDWDMALGLFYPELMEQDELWITQAQLPELKDWHEFWASYDWGFVHPAVCCQFVRVKDTIYLLDTLYMHRFQDEEQGATISGWADKRCLRMVYAGHDVKASRQAHAAAAETVQDVFARYSINLELANIDRMAGAKVLRRFFAKPKTGPLLRGQLVLRIVDTPGNRRALTEARSLIPDEVNPNVPMKRDANEKGQNGDDGIDAIRYGLATPTFDPIEPLPPMTTTNVADGKGAPLPWEPQAFGARQLDDGTIDRRVYTVRHGLDDADNQFSEEADG